MKIINNGPADYRGTTNEKLPGPRGMKLLIINVGQTVRVEDDEFGKSLVLKFKNSKLHALSDANDNQQKIPVVDTAKAKDNSQAKGK